MRVTFLAPARTLVGGFCGETGQRSKGKEWGGGPGAGEVTGDNPSDSVFDSFVRRPLNFVNHIERYSDFQSDPFPKTFLSLNTLGKSCSSWLLLVVMEEVECATVRGSLLFLAVSTRIDFFFTVGKSQSGRGIKN